MLEAGTEFDNLSTRDKLDILLQDERINPLLRSVTSEMVGELRDQAVQQHPGETKYEELLCIMLNNHISDRNRLTTGDEVAPLFDDVDFDNTDYSESQAIANILSRMRQKFKNKGDKVKVVHVSAWRFEIDGSV